MFSLEKIFEELQLASDARIGCAVSGGGDSMALAHFLINAAKEKAFSLNIIHIDHNLRTESENEANFVKKQFLALGVKVSIRKWQHEGVKSALQEKARKFRHDAIQKWAREKSCSAVFYAHHADDQIETILMRMARGSALGLAGMQTINNDYDVPIVRPLLDICKDELLAYNQAHKVPYIEDPSNIDSNFERVRWRQAITHLKDCGLEGKMVNLSAKRLAAEGRKVEKLHGLIAAYAISEKVIDSNKTISIDVKALKIDGLAQELMSIALKRINPNGQVRLSVLDRMFGQILNNNFKKQTLMGCVLDYENNSLKITAEKK